MSHHHHCHDKHEHSSCCHEESCKTEEASCEHEGQCCFAKSLLALADEAWMELLKDKIKKEIELASGQHLDQLAKLVSGTNHERWMRKIGKKKAIAEYEKKLGELFCGS